MLRGPKPDESLTAGAGPSLPFQQVPNAGPSAPIAVPAGPPAAPSEALRQAHERMLHDQALQFRFDAPQPPPANPPDLSWLAAIMRLLGPILQALFWIVVAVVIGSIVWFVVREVLRSKFPERFGKRKPKDAVVEWRPEPEEARELLQDADALAAQGRFAEAAHLLLLRSVEDIHGRDAELLRPSLTSRDIAELERLPSLARGAFGLIAEVVEHSFFGGREVDESGWAACRRAYADFALPGHWSAAA